MNKVTVYMLLSKKYINIKLIFMHYIIKYKLPAKINKYKNPLSNTNCYQYALSILYT
jgi:hypothetical protein